MANKKKKKNNNMNNRNKTSPAAAKQTTTKAADVDEAVEAAAAPAAKKATAPKKETAAARNAARKATTAPRKKKGMSAGMQWGLIGLVGAAIIGLFVILPAVQDAADDGGPGEVAADSFDLPVLDDQDNLDNRVRISDFNGTPTVVNFFASWCTACDDELPHFRDAALELEGEVDFIFVNSNETGNWQPMAERNEIDDLILAQDIQGTRRNGLYRSLGGTGGMPITAFYGADGTLLDVSFTAFDDVGLDRALAGLNFIDA